MGFTSLHFYLGSLAERAAHGECERANVNRGVVVFQTGASATRPSETPRTAIRTPTRRSPLAAAAAWAAGRGTFASTQTSTAVTAAAAPGGTHRRRQAPLPPPLPPPLPAVLEWGKSPIRPHSCRPQVTTSPLSLQQRKNSEQLGTIGRSPGYSSPFLLRARHPGAGCHLPPPPDIYIPEIDFTFRLTRAIP